MKINTKTVDSIQVVEIIGDIDGKTAPDAQAAILPLADSGSRILLDMSRIDYMSSAGLRTMLLIHRSISATEDAKIVLVGLSDEIKDMMNVTGFLAFFEVRETYDDGLVTLGE